jgi:hypothetical protein
MSSSVCFMKLVVPALSVYVYNCYLLLMDCSLYQYEVAFFVSSEFGLKSALSDMSIATPAYFQIPFASISFPILLL